MNFTKLHGALLLVCFGLIASIASILFLYSGRPMNMQKNSIAIPVVLTPTLSPSPQDRRSLIVKASIPYWDQKNAFDSFQAHTNAIDHINMFWYFLTSEGELRRYEDAIEDITILEYAHRQNIQVAAVITNLPEYTGSTWDSERVESMLADNKKRKKHIHDIYDLVAKIGFDGVIIDYEQVERRTKSDFSQFIKELTEELHKGNKYVSVVLHPKIKVSDERQGNGAFQDWKTLSKYADQLQIMAYGEHWDEGEEGPIASIGWVRDIILYAEFLDIPKEKLYLGIPLYGYDWNLDTSFPAKGLTYQEVVALVKSTNSTISWSDEFKSPFFSYKKNSEDHEVWFENAQSVNEKIKLAQDSKFAGITFWRLGGEDPAIWNIVSTY